MDNGAVLLFGSLVWFGAAYFLYGKYLKKLFGIEYDRPTPAHTMTDGVDYVPAKFPVLFGHHFASIAGAGPILGPILAAYFGWLPALLWILVGCVFVGAFHDFAALFLSVRSEGRSIGHVIEEQIGYTGRQIFLVFCWVALVLVIATFGHVVAATFIKVPAVATASLLFIAMAPAFGFLVYRKNVSILVGSLVFVPLLFVFVWVGTKLPLDLTQLCGCSAESARTIWLLVLFAYVCVASIIPVWVLLQPRDYLNSYLLYAMMLFGFLGVLLFAPKMEMPAFGGLVAENAKGMPKHLFPLLFVTIACGACSGFHSLVSSGTTSKQIGSEKDILGIGYGGMLVEGLLAVMALISVAFLGREGYVQALGDGGGAVAAFSNGLATFATTLGIEVKTGTTFVALAVSAFLLTTLDTATRLARFTWQEILQPRSSGPQGETPKPQGVFAWAGNAWTATFVSVLCAALLVFTPARAALWPVFGASNQLLAALTLLAITLYLVRKKANFWVAFVPMVFMFVISVWALVVLLLANWGKNWTLFVTTGFLLIMALVLACQAVMSLRRVRREQE